MTRWIDADALMDWLRRSDSNIRMVNPGLSMYVEARTDAIATKITELEAQAPEQQRAERIALVAGAFDWLNAYDLVGTPTDERAELARIYVDSMETASDG